MDLLIDIDQTIFPLFQAIQKLPGGENVFEEDCVAWESLAEMCQRPVDEMIDEAIQPEIATSVGLYPGASEVILDLANENIDIALATHRDRKYESATKEFLAHQGLDGLPLYIDSDLEKIGLLFSNGLLVDDAPDTMEAAYLKGAAVTALEHRYNDEVANLYGIPRGKDWNQLEVIIKTILF